MPNLLRIFVVDPASIRYLMLDMLLLWYGLGRPVITSEIGNWSVFVLLGWRFVFGIIMKRDGQTSSFEPDNGVFCGARLVGLVFLSVTYI